MVNCLTFDGLSVSLTDVVAFRCCSASGTEEFDFTAKIFSTKTVTRSLFDLKRSQTNLPALKNTRYGFFRIKNVFNSIVFGAASLVSHSDAGIGHVFRAGATEIIAAILKKLTTSIRG